MSLRPKSSLAWLVGASLTPPALVTILGLLHTLQAHTDYSFKSPSSGLVFYGVWGVTLAITSRKSGPPLPLLNLAFFLSSLLLLNFVLLLLKWVGLVLPPARYLFLILFAIAFVWGALHLLLARWILGAPVRSAEVLIPGLLVAGLEVAFYLMGLSSSRADATNPNMLGFAALSGLKFALVGLFLSRAVVRIPSAARPPKPGPVGRRLAQALVSFTPWPFALLFVFASTDTSVQKCGDPLIACFVVALVGVAGILFFSGTALLWGLTRWPHLRQRKRARRLNYALMILSGLPLWLPITYLSFTLLFPG